MDVNCPNCGAANRNTSHFCAKCGKALPRPEHDTDEGAKAKDAGGLNLPWLQAVKDRAVKQTGGLSPDVLAQVEASKAAQDQARGRPQTEAQAGEPEMTQAAQEAEQQAMPDEGQAVEAPEEGAPPRPGGEGTPDEPPPEWVVGILEPNAERKPAPEQSYESEELDHIMPWLAGPPDAIAGTPTAPGKPGLPPWLSGITVQETLESTGPKSPSNVEELEIEGLEPFAPPEAEEGIASEPIDTQAGGPAKLPDWIGPLASGTAGGAGAEIAGAGQELASAGATSASAGTDPSLRSGDLAPTDTLMAPMEHDIRVRPPRPGSVETLAALLQTPMGDAARRPVPGIGQPVVESAARKVGLRQWLLPDGLIYIVIVAALLAVLLINPPFGEQNAPGAPDVTSFFNQIERVPTGKAVLVAYDWDASRSAEMSALSEAVTRHLMMRHLPFVTISTVPQGPGFAQLVTDATRDSYSYRYGQDYIVLGYLPGNEAALRSLTGDFVGSLPPDYISANPADLGSLRGANKIASLGDFGLIIVLTSDETALRNWIEQVSSRTNVALVAAVPQGLEPMARPYENVPGVSLNAVLSGPTGALRYVQQLTESGHGTTGQLTSAKLAESLNALSVAQIIVILTVLAALVTLGTRRIMRNA